MRISVLHKVRGKQHKYPTVGTCGNVANEFQITSDFKALQAMP